MSTSKESPQLEGRANTNGEPLFKANSVLNSLRYGEYDTSAALGEFIDNSVEAGAKNISLYIKGESIAVNDEGKQARRKKGKVSEMVTEIALVDNGAGMNEFTLSKCLVLGETIRTPRPDGSKGIGRFGVGMTIGGISLAKRIEVYSRISKNEEFDYVSVDLDEVSSNEQVTIKPPVHKKPPVEYAERLQDAPGTVVILKKCDRLQNQPAEHNKGVDRAQLVNELKSFIGRTFRKFIYSGFNISVNDEPVSLHDPLYLLGPTRFDTKDKVDLRAKQIGNIDSISLDVPGSPNQKADITIKMSLLPIEWRENRGAGNSNFAQERKIPENQGISVLRADREVLYGHVPYILGPRGQAASQELDRWWGCEISFPPELDAYFQVRYIKRGAEPVPFLRDMIRERIGGAVETLRKQIQEDWKETAQAQAAQKGVFDEAEQAMAKANSKLPRPSITEPPTAEAEADEIAKIADESEEARGSDSDAETKAVRKQELASKPFSIVPVKYPASFFYEPVFLLGKIIVKLNVNHPFYKQVFAPLCGSIEHFNDDSDFMDGADTPEQRLARKGFMLMLLSHAKAESFFLENNRDMLDNLRNQWGMTLASALVG